MKKTLLVAVHELAVNLRRPGFVIMTLLVPAVGLAALVIVSLFGGEVGGFFTSQFTPEDSATGYVDNSGLLNASLPQYAGRFIPYDDEASARSALLANEINSYFVLPADYMQTGQVRVFRIGSGFSTFTAADNGEIRSFLLDHLLAGKVDAAIQERVRAPMDLRPIALNDAGGISTESPFSWVGDFVVPYLFSILFVVTIFTASGFLLQSVAEEKEGRIIEILLSSMSATQLLAGKILGLGALGLIQVLIWIGAVAALLSVAVLLYPIIGFISIGLDTVLLGLVYFILGYVLFATLMAVGGSMGTTIRESQQIAGLFSMAAAIPWMVMGVVFAQPNAALAQALSYFPLTAPVMMLLRLAFSQVPAGQIVISLLCLTAGIVISLWAGAKIFRMALLMYGKRPGLKDLARAFRQA